MTRYGVAVLLVTVLMLGGCDTSWRAKSGGGADSQCASQESLSLVIRSLSDALPKSDPGARPPFNQRVDVEREFPLTSPTALSDDPKVGRTSCSAEVTLKGEARFGNIPNNVKTRIDDAGTHVTLNYVIGHRADSGAPFAEVDRVDDLAMMLWSAHMMNQPGFDPRTDPSPTPDGYDPETQRYGVGPPDDGNDSDPVWNSEKPGWE